MMNHHFEQVADPVLRPAADTFTAIAGLDLSMTKTGVAVWRAPGRVYDREGGTVLDRIDTDPKDWRTGVDAKGAKVATYGDRFRRMSHITARVLARIPEGSLVFVEAPSYGSVGAGTFDRSGLWWMTYAALYRWECRVVAVPPSNRAQYATGKGGGKDAGKDAVIANVARRYPELDVTDNNVADAVVLMAMARRHAGDPMEALIPAANLKALDKIEEL